MSSSPSSSPLSIGSLSRGTQPVSKLIFDTTDVLFHSQEDRTDIQMTEDVIIPAPKPSGSKQPETTSRVARNSTRNRKSTHSNLPLSTPLYTNLPETTSSSPKTAKSLTHLISTPSSSRSNSSSPKLPTAKESELSSERSVSSLPKSHSSSRKSSSSSAVAAATSTVARARSTSPVSKSIKSSAIEMDTPVISNSLTSFTRTDSTSKSGLVGSVEQVKNEDATYEMDVDNTETSAFHVFEPVLKDKSETGNTSNKENGIEKQRTDNHTNSRIKSVKTLRRFEKRNLDELKPSTLKQLIPKPRMSKDVEESPKMEDSVSAKMDCMNVESNVINECENLYNNQHRAKITECVKNKDKCSMNDPNKLKHKNQSCERNHESRQKEGTASTIESRWKEGTASTIESRRKEGTASTIESARPTDDRRHSDSDTMDTSACCSTPTTDGNRRRKMGNKQSMECSDNISKPKRMLSLTPGSSEYKELAHSVVFFYLFNYFFHFGSHVGKPKFVFFLVIGDLGSRPSPSHFTNNYIVS